ncbi:MAG: patatin-like phospholipase family protein [Paeniclostridium sordellii]|uniref:Patatin-like phospholipase family protein n=1 Tax=Paeniclostridium hominis TaxID=2764329 RepID=A0ABR7K566_9FIRM|nr:MULTISPECIES: patatin-like phospholipase family protein [Paeniclostridium]MBC6004252.1 patatin-like phospholipase family protein [Paeniclostridium hominis]MDU2591964.1 patatin-like phospholipase family protein [Paeniclostridium sordellii]
MKTGLCLAGGGAKGAFQAGVIYGLYEKGIKFDAIAGTSIGAINGYYIYTENVNKLKEMWINIQKIGENGIKIVDNTVDNSLAIDELRGLINNSSYSKPCYINYVEVENSKLEEKIVDISELSYEDALLSIKYSSLLPFRPSKELKPFEQFGKDLIEGLYDGYKLDGGILNNVLIKPLIEAKMDKIIVITMKHDYELPEDIKNIYKEEDIIIIRPNTIFEKNATLRFEGEFCKKIFNEGYEIVKNMDINL